MTNITRPGYVLIDTKGEGAARYMIKNTATGEWEFFSNNYNTAIEALDRLAEYGVNYLSLKEALNEGYKLADTTLQRGYVKTGEDPLKARIRWAGGKRKNQPYILLNNPHSSQYCIRQYLTRED